MAAELIVTNKKDKKDLKFPAIPGYRILGQLGTGGMATVYLANQESFDREVAIKVMAPVLAADANYGERFMREARIAARFSHPNIIAVYDVGAHDDYYYIAMEYHPGGDLKARLKKNMTTRQAMSILRQIAAALDYAHHKGFIHRDVKPDNIMFRDDGSAVLTDFGIARPASGDAQMTQLGMVVGTPKYMSPEQARGQELDSRSDIYSLGIVFYEMLIGKVPFDGKDSIAIGIKHVKEPVPSLPPHLAALQPLVDRILAKNTAERYSSGRELITDLDKLRLGTLRNRKRDDSGQPRPTAATHTVHQAQARTASGGRALDDTIPPASTGGRRRSWVRLAVLAACGGIGYYAWTSGALVPLWQQFKNSEVLQQVKSSEMLRQVKESDILRQGREALSALLEGQVQTAPATDEQQDQYRQEPGRYSAGEDTATRMAGTSLGIALNTPLYPAQLPSNGIAIQAAAALIDIDPRSLPPVDNQTRIINAILADAGTLRAAGLLVSPPGNNALESYNNVLTLEETNAEALAGRHGIALHYIELADQALATENLKAAARYLQRAQLAAPELTAIADRQHRLDATRQQQQARIAAAQAQADLENNRADAMLDRFKITGLLRRADYDVAERRYTSPAGNNALHKYRQVLQLRPDNAQAQQGIQALMLRLQGEFDQAVDAGDEAQAMALSQELKLVNAR